MCSVPEDGEYMSFGLSGDDTRSKMIGGDVVVAWVDKTTLKGYAYDYFLDAKSQCAGTRGSCPDERLRVTCSSLISFMLLTIYRGQKHGLIL
jgi:serine protease inhibitor ecotin